MKKLALAILVLCACQSAEPPPGPAPMSAAELDRAAEACASYVARLCGCAGDDRSLKERCDLAGSQPQAVSLHRELLSGKSPRGPLNADERAATEMSLRKIVAACVKGDAELDPKTCPRR